jgi:hypothetical protein
MKNPTILFVALGLAALPSCSKYFAQARAEEAVQLIEKMSDIFDNDKGDCNKMASDLDSFIKENDAKFKKLKEAEAKESPEEKKEFEQKYKPRIDAAMKKMQPGIMACATNAKVMNAMKSMPK